MMLYSTFSKTSLRFFAKKRQRVAKNYLGPNNALNARAGKKGYT
jgi:hypothetical protein